MKTAFPDDVRRRWVQFGCGPHPLPSPWENYDREVNITEALPFPDESCQYLVAEHVIEHVPFAAGLAFLRECHRVLEPGGVLRLSFPDVSRFMKGSAPDWLLDEAVEQRRTVYGQWLERTMHRPNTLASIFAFLLAGSGHKAAWTLETAGASCIAAGFLGSHEEPLGCSAHDVLQHVDRHQFSVPVAVAVAETTTIEATK